MERRRRHDTRARACPRPKIDANAKGRHPLRPEQRRLITALKARLIKSGISASEAGRIAGVDPGDARRVLAFGAATPRTLRKLFDAFNVNEYEELSAAERRGAILLQLRAAAERQADLLGELAALSLGDDPPGL